MRAHLERLAANITHVFPYVVVDHPNVRFQITRAAKTFPAHFAHVFPPFRAAVHASSVCDHVREAVKHHLAIGTRVLDLPCVYGVRVNPHRSRVRKRLSAYFTHDFVLPYFQVYPFDVLPEVAGADKTLATYITQQLPGLLPLVDPPEVVLHVALLIKQLLAGRTLKHLPSLVYGLHVDLQPCQRGELPCAGLAGVFLPCHAHVHHQAVCA